jgi:hypothetical protein
MSFGIIPGEWGWRNWRSWQIEKLIKMMMLLGLVAVGAFSGAIMEAWLYGLR